MTYAPPPQILTQRRLRRPGVGIMWVNAFLSWSGLAFIYLVYLTIRNVVWAKQNEQPWLRYIAPLATIVILVVGLYVWARTLTSTTPRARF